MIIEGQGDRRIEQEKFRTNLELLARFTAVQQPNISPFRGPFHCGNDGLTEVGGLPKGLQILTNYHSDFAIVITMRTRHQRSGRIV